MGIAEFEYVNEYIRGEGPDRKWVRKNKIVLEEIKVDKPLGWRIESVVRVLSLPSRMWWSDWSESEEKEDSAKREKYQDEDSKTTSSPFKMPAQK